MDYALRWELRVTVRGLPPDRHAVALQTHLDEVMERLVEQETGTPEVFDPSVGVDLGEGLVEIDLIVDAESVADAVKIGDSFARAAVHAAGGYTAGWQRRDPGELGQVDYGLLDVRAEPSRA